MGAEVSTAARAREAVNSPSRETAPPMVWTWDGLAMTPKRPAMADHYFVIGQTYTFAPWEDRSEVSHRHEFAWLREAWKNLPESMAATFPTPDRLRKAALIEAGYFTERMVDAGSNAAALRVAAFMRAGNEDAKIVVRGPVVVERTAQSQSRRYMDAKTFQASKTAVLEIVAGLIGVTPQALQQNADQSA